MIIFAVKVLLIFELTYKIRKKITKFEKKRMFFHSSWGKYEIYYLYSNLFITFLPRFGSTNPTDYSITQQMQKKECATRHTQNYLHKKLKYYFKPNLVLSSEVISVLSFSLINGIPAVTSII